MTRSSPPLIPENMGCGEGIERPLVLLLLLLLLLLLSHCLIPLLLLSAAAVGDNVPPEDLYDASLAYIAESVITRRPLLLQKAQALLQKAGRMVQYRGQGAEWGRSFSQET